MSQVAKQQFIDHPRVNHHVSNLAAGIFNSMLALGQMTSPLYGALVYNHAGFRITCDLVAIMSFVLAFVYLFVGKGYEAMLDPCSRKQIDDNFKKENDTKEVLLEQKGN